MHVSLRSLVFALVLAVFLLPVGSSGQVAISVGAGLVSSTLTGDDTEDVESQIGFSLGGSVGFQLTDRVALAPGVVYVQKGATEGGGGTDVDLNLTYIEFPIVLGVRLTPAESETAFSLFGGPSIAFDAGCSLEGSEGGVPISFDCDDPDLDGEFETVDFGAVLGGHIQFPAGENRFIWVNAGVDIGLKSIDGDASSEDSIKNRAFFLSAGIGFIVGG